MPAVRRKKTRARNDLDVKQLSVNVLVPTADNKRRPITKASVKSLAQSMSKSGVLQPIVVRKHPTERGCFEIRAGERRWRAAKLAGLKTIPCIVRELDDSQALSITIDENLEREDPHPLEQAATIQQAFDRGVENELAARLGGKSLKWLARRASLTRLVKVWQDEILRPESEAGRLSVTHLELIARLPEETQLLLAENEFELVFGQGFPTLAQLTRVIDGGLHSLKAMPWPLNDEILVPAAGSCLNCPKRSGKQPLLFDDSESASNGKVTKSDRCLDPSCFDRKLAAHMSRCETKLRDKHPDLKLVQVTSERLSLALSEAFGDRAIRTYLPITVKAGSRGALPAMPIDGAKAGQLIFLANSKLDESKSSKSGHPRDAQGKAIPLTLAERKERLQRRRDAFLVNKVAAILKALTIDSLERTVSSLSKRRDDAAKSFDMPSLTLAFGTASRADRIRNDAAWEKYDQLRKLPANRKAAAALHDVVQIWIKRLSGVDSSTASAQATDAKRMSAILGIDLTATEKEAVQTIPQPKSWAALTDDGSPRLIANSGKKSRTAPSRRSSGR